MSGVLDFLFEGKPPASVTSYGTATQNMPQWLSDYTQGLISKANAVAGEPYQAYGGPRLADFTPQQKQSFDLTSSIVGQQNGTLGAALGTAGDVAGGPLGAAAAAPYMASAARTFPQAVSQYMDPYIENVTNRNAMLTQRALSEQLMPTLARTFGGAGGQDARSSAYLREANRGTRDLAESLQAQNLAALSGGFSQAGTLFGQDASRMGTLASLAGSQASNDAATRLSAAGQQGTLAALQKQLGLTDVGALQASGAQQQGATQQSLDLAYQDYLKQLNYPKEQLAFMQSAVQGLPFSQSTSYSGVGPANAVGPSTLQQLGSTATGIAGLIGAMKGLNMGTETPTDKAGMVARGGIIRRPMSRRYARGGLVRGTLRRL